LLVLCDRSVRCCGSIAGGSPGLQIVGRRQGLGAFCHNVAQRGFKAGPFRLESPDPALHRPKER
jgi:hypothetical protein